MSFLLRFPAFFGLKSEHTLDVGRHPFSTINISDIGEIGSTVRIK